MAGHCETQARRANLTESHMHLINSITLKSQNTLADSNTRTMISHVHRHGYATTRHMPSETGENVQEVTGTRALHNKQWMPKSSVCPPALLFVRVGLCVSVCGRVLARACKSASDMPRAASSWVSHVHATHFSLLVVICVR